MFHNPKRSYAQKLRRILRSLRNSFVRLKSSELHSDRSSAAESCLAFCAQLNATRIVKSKHLLNLISIIYIFVIYIIYIYNRTTGSPPSGNPVILISKAISLLLLFHACYMNHMPYKLYEEALTLHTLDILQDL